MTTDIWVGGTGLNRFSVAKNWSHQKVPGSTDTVQVLRGSPELDLFGAIDIVAMQNTGTIAYKNSSQSVADFVTSGNVTNLTGATFGIAHYNIDIGGTFTNGGTATIEESQATNGEVIAHAIVNSGVLNLSAVNQNFLISAPVNNLGTINVSFSENGSQKYSSPTFGGKITGKGTIEGGTMDFSGPVASTVNVVCSSTVLWDAPQFAGLIHPEAQTQVVLGDYDGSKPVSYSFKENSAGTVGTLTAIQNGMHAHIHFAGDYTAANFSINPRYSNDITFTANPSATTT